MPCARALAIVWEIVKMKFMETFLFRLMLEEQFNVMYSLRYTTNFNVNGILMNCFGVISPAKEYQDNNKISFGRISAGGSNHIKQRLVSPNMK